MMESFSQTWRLMSETRQKQGWSPLRPLSLAGRPFLCACLCLNFLFSYETTSPIGSGPSLMTSFDLNYLLQDFCIQTQSEAGEFRKSTCDLDGRGERVGMGRIGMGTTQPTRALCVCWSPDRSWNVCCFSVRNLVNSFFFFPEESEGCEMVGLCSSRDLLRRRWSLGLALGRKNVLTFH